VGDDDRLRLPVGDNRFLSLLLGDDSLSWFLRGDGDLSWLVDDLFLSLFLGEDCLSRPLERDRWRKEVGRSYRGDQERDRDLKGALIFDSVKFKNASNCIFLWDLSFHWWVESPYLYTLFLTSYVSFHKPASMSGAVRRSWSVTMLLPSTFRTVVVARAVGT